MKTKRIVCTIVAITLMAVMMISFSLNSLAATTYFSNTYSGSGTMYSTNNPQVHFPLGAYGYCIEKTSSDTVRVYVMVDPPSSYIRGKVGLKFYDSNTTYFNQTTPEADYTRSFDCTFDISTHVNYYFQLTMYLRSTDNQYSAQITVTGYVTTTDGNLFKIFIT